MLLDYLRNFTWYNEPENVRFIENGMEIETLPQSEFWQHGQNNSQDSGHFFYSKQSQNFKLVLQWELENFANFAQCGLMLRKDEKNWFKAAILKLPKSETPLICSSLTINGYSDWAEIPLSEEVKRIKFSIKSQDKDNLVTYHSPKGEHPIRMFHFQGEELKVGAYICSPGKTSFLACLVDMDLT